MENKVFVILSNQPYDGASRTNKHYISDELVKRGYKVVFIDPPTRFKFVKSILKKGKLELLSKKAENFYVYYPVNIFNFIPFTWFNNLLHFIILKFLVLKKLKIDSKNIILWVYHFDFPGLFFFKNLLHPSVFIYDVVDNYEEFPEYSQMDTTNFGIVKLIQKVDLFFRVHFDQYGLSGKKWVIFQEKRLAKEADLMYASHPLLYEKFKKLTKNITYTPNAGEFDVFSKKPGRNLPELEKIPHPRVLYSGALDNYKFDAELFEYVVKNMPKINFALIGPVRLADSDTRIKSLEKYPNVYFMGQISKGDIYSHFYDAYIIPYRLNDSNYYGCFPIKLFNAMSTGVPIVLTDLPAYRGLETVTYISKSKEDFVKNLSQAVIEKDLSLRQKRIEVASQNTWSNKVDKQLLAISKVISKK